VARVLNRAGLGTLLFDLLIPAEEPDRSKVFDIELLAERLAAATRWLHDDKESSGLPIGYFGASTGAATALWAASSSESRVFALVSRGGRPDLAGPQLADVRAPTLLIVGSEDLAVLELNRQAAAQLRWETALTIIAGATHLFEERGTFARAAELARDWFLQHLAR
jgi:dienelactone hydrolase